MALSPPEHRARADPCRKSQGAVQQGAVHRRLGLDVAAVLDEPLGRRGSVGQGTTRARLNVLWGRPAWVLDRPPPQRRGAVLLILVRDRTRKPVCGALHSREVEV